MSAAAADRFAQMIELLAGRQASSRWAPQRITCEPDEGTDDDAGLVELVHADVWRSLVRSIEASAK